MEQQILVVRWRSILPGSGYEAVVPMIVGPAAVVPIEPEQIDACHAANGQVRYLPPAGTV